VAVIEVGRYLIGERIASGGTANVHLGQVRGAAGFVRAVAIKMLHPALTQDAELVAAMIDEAHVVSNIRHPNVVPMLDVLSEAGELYLVMEYVHGDSLAQLVKETRRRGEHIPHSVVVGIAVDVLRGLHAAHEAVDERGASLAIVHRDVSPKNIMVGADGVTRVVDFGIAKATVRAQTTQEGQLKGTLGYMSPEQLGSASIDRRSDIFAAGIVVWELLAGRRLFQADSAGEVVGRVLLAPIAVPSSVGQGVSAALDAAVMRALARERGERYLTAQAFADALVAAAPPAGAREIGAWVANLAAETLSRRTRAMRASTEQAEPAKVTQEDATAPTARDQAAVPQATAIEEAPVALPVASAAKRRKPAAAVVTIGVGVLIGVSAKLYFAAATAPPSAPPSAVASEPAVMSAAATKSALPARSSGSVSAAANASSAAASDLPLTSAPREIPSGTQRRPPAAPSAPRAQKDCDPPYVMKGGIKHIKPECL
jgi:eukaryotic-like serine/threonine-protein kinase